MLVFPLEDYPLAKKYGWKANKVTTGGILYIYPPLASWECKSDGGESVTHHALSRERWIDVEDATCRYFVRWTREVWSQILATS